MPVNIPTSVGYGKANAEDTNAGRVYQEEWAKLVPNAGGREYGVIGPGSWQATIGSADREIRIAPGSGFGHGILDTTDAEARLQLPAASSGSAWHLVVAHRDWQNRRSSFDTIPAGNGDPSIPPRETIPGTLDDQPLYLLRVQAGQSQIQEIRDLRVWGGDGGALARDELVLQYLNRLGTQVLIGNRRWARVLDALGSAAWTDLGVGRLLGVYPLSWFGLAPSGQLGPDVSVWGNQVQSLARFTLPDPGVPFRVQMYAQGFWGRELDSTGARYDFDMMVGQTPIATKLPAADEFMFSNWRSWSPPASAAIFTGEQALGFRARRITGAQAYGAVRESESSVIATVFSA